MATSCQAYFRGITSTLGSLSVCILNSHRQRKKTAIDDFDMETCFASDEGDPLQAGDAEHSSQGGGDEDPETKDNMKEVQRQELIETQENEEGDLMDDTSWILVDSELPKACILEVYARDGSQLLKLREDDLDWPDEHRTLYPDDVLALLRISPDEFCLYDLFPKAASQNQQVQIVECDKQMNFGEAYTIDKRPCARCTICKHLWCRPQDHSRKDKWLLIIQVEGYYNGSGLHTRFSDDELLEELNGIEEQYATERPSHFGVRWRRYVRARLM